MDLDSKLSCDNVVIASSTSSCDIFAPTKKSLLAQDADSKKSKSSSLSGTSSTTSSTITPKGFQSECRLHKIGDAPNIGYELAVAKSIMQQYSTLSGDNLFDHLAEIIKRVIDERPPNVIDFFEEFSRNVREQKLHLPERFPPEGSFEESRMYRVAKKLLLSMKLPYAEDSQNVGIDEMSLEETRSTKIDELKLDIDNNERLFITFHQCVQKLQFYWNQCGFSINSDDIFQLACSMNRLQTHPSILQCRFWGVINGLRASYYIVEASLTVTEIESRLQQMQKEMLEKMPKKKSTVIEEPTLPTFVGPELTPGENGWENYPPEELAKMRPAVDPIPLAEYVEVFDIPPEAIGLGVNRYSYFVVNALSDDWIELPIVTPKQIVASRQIKKFLTGDLQAEIFAYPCFPGKEKHYLRALIGRITAGSYIAPDGYYRKMTKREKRLFEGILDDEMEEEEEEEEPMMDEDEEIDNDIVLLKNEKYTSLPINSLAPPVNWVHVRPNILKQGRVVWFDEAKARRDRDKELARIRRLQLMEEMGEEYEEEEEEEAEPEGEEEGLLEGMEQPEIGPPMLSPCNNDVSQEYTVPWIARFTSRFTNKNERIIVMHSNVWPGAYTFAFDKCCESIYMGWGHKYVSRNMAFEHLPLLVDEFPHDIDDFIETVDPSVAEEEAYRQWLLRKQQQKEMPDSDEHLDDEFENDDDDDFGTDDDE